MRNIPADSLRDAVRRLCLEAGRSPDPNLLPLLEKAVAREQSAFGQETLGQLIENIHAAKAQGLPLCQDTGMAVVFIDIGQDAHIVGGSLAEAVHEGVRQGYKEGYFRASVVSPLSRENTRDNTPAILYTTLTPGDQIRITVAPKGFGSENMSRILMLPPSAGEEGMLQGVVNTVSAAGANPCPPVVLGVGVGGTFEYAALMAKRALLRPLGQPSPDPVLAKHETTLLERINRLGIGPMGLGGDTTALAVHILAHETHIAGLPVAVNMQCHAVRHAECTL